MKPKDFLLASASGLLLVLAFPKFNLEALAWVAFLPLFWALRGQNPSRGALLGFVSGFVFFAGLLYWIYVVLTDYGHLPGAASIFLLVVLWGYLALYFAAFAFLLRWAESKNGFSPVLFAPPLWVALEYIRGYLLSGFPWELLGYSQFLTLPVVQVADLTGVYGVSFLILLVNAALYRLAGALVEGQWRPALKETAAAGILLALTVFYGYVRIQELQAPARGDALKIAVAQGNIRQDIKWEPRFQDETVRIYEELTVKSASVHPDLIVWPETATPFFFQNSYPYRTRILNLAQRVAAPILFGSIAFDRGRGRGRVDYFNSAFLVSPQREILGRYDKIHLVPFGEYAPLSGLLGFTRDIIGAMGDLASGEEVRTLPLRRQKFGVLICYEAIFPGLTRRFVDEGADFLVNITNDAWFGRTAAPYQHISMAALRAVENRVPMARAANTGISGLIDATGRIGPVTGLFTREVLWSNIQIGKGGKTFYTRFGDVFSYLCLVFTASVIIFYLRRGYRVERNKR